MTKISLRVVTVLYVFSKSLTAQTTPDFKKVQYQLLNEYVQFLDSVERKKLEGNYFKIYKSRHTSFVEFSDDRLVYRISKRVKLYKSGMRYEKIDWTIHYYHSFWHHKIYEIKQVGESYRFIEQINYEFGRKLRRTKITTSFDDNYLSVKILRPKDKKATYFYVKPMSGLPLIHQD
jgi:hypothetical protein